MTYDGSNRRRMAEETRNRIFRSAERLFTERGPDAVSVDAIVQAAGVAKGSFYVHFASKDALFMELVNDKVAMLDAKYQSFLDALPERMPVHDVILSLVDRISDILVADIGVESMTNVYKAQLSGDAGIGAVADYNRDLYIMYRELLERGIARGEIRTDIGADTLTRHLLLAIRGITYEWCIRQPDFDYKAQARAHLKLLLEGLSPRATE